MDTPVDSERITLAATWVEGPEVLSNPYVVGEAMEIRRYEDFGGGNLRWKVAETQIAYPLLTDGAPNG